MHESQKCCGELEEVTVDNVWQITDAGDQKQKFVCDDCSDNYLWQETQCDDDDDDDSSEVKKTLGVASLASLGLYRIR